MDRLSRLNQILIFGGKILVGVIMTSTVLLLFVNVALRYVFGHAISWAEEVTRCSLLWTVFVGAGVIAREGAHVSMEAFFNIWPEKIKRIGQLLINLFCVFTLCIIFYLGSGMVRLVMDTGQISEAASIPMWIIYAAFPVGSLLIILGYIETAWRQWAAKPLAVGEIYLGKAEEVH